MKTLITFVLAIFSSTILAQRPDSLEIPSNSFENIYRVSNPELIYSYDEISQIHNYSNNWDFDKDGIKDELYFVGTGGAHLYYFLKVVLSTDKKSRELEFILSDFPFLTATDTFNIEKTLFGFAVADLGKDLTPTIIVRLDEQTFYGNEELLKRNIKTEHVLVSFENGKTKFGCL